MADSGWIGVTAGLVSASITVITGFLLEDYRRHRDRQATAMAFLGEIKTLVDLSRSHDLSGSARTFADAIGPLTSLPPGFGTTEVVKLGNPVFDRTAEKIGLLSGEIPMLISEFYKYVNGVRITYFGAVASGPMSVASRVAALDLCAEQWTQLQDRTDKHLIPELRLASTLKWRLWPRVEAASQVSFWSLTIRSLSIQPETAVATWARVATGRADPQPASTSRR